MFRKIHPSWQFYAYLIGIIAGIVFSSWFKIIFCLHWLWLIASLLLLLLCLKFPFKSFAIAALFAGILLGNYRVGAELVDQQILQNFIGSNLTLRAKIAEDPDLESSRATLRLKEISIQIDDDNWLDLSGTLYAQLNTNVELKRSDSVTISGKLGTGFGTFLASMYRPKLLAVERDESGDVFASLKTSFAKVVQSYLPAPASGLGLGYLVGLKTGLSDELSETLQLVGMTHVVVASGAHLGILVGAARKLFGKISKFSGTMFAFLLILFFVLVVGFTPSMTRAALVTSLSLLMGYIGRKFTPFRLIIFVATITLLLVPSNFINLGWQLSFASFFGILIVAPKLQRLLYGGKHPPWLASMLLTSLSTSLICAPILVYNFGSLSLLSFIANLVILPTLPYAMLLVFLTGVTSFWPFLATFFGKLASLLLNLHIFVLNYLSAKKMFIIDLPSSDPRIFLLYIPVVILLLARKRKICYNEKHENQN